MSRHSSMSARPQFDAPRGRVSRRTLASGLAWSVPVVVVATSAPASAASPDPCTVTPAVAFVYYDAKYTCSPLGNPTGFDPERYLMAFGVTTTGDCPGPVPVPGPVLVRVEERGDSNRPLTDVHVVKYELTDFAGLTYNGQTFPAGQYLAVTFFHPTGWGSPNVNGNTFYSLSVDGGVTWLDPYDLYNFELGNLDTANTFDPDRPDTYLCS